ncbi:MAG TPA: periplasmic Cu(I)/Cu(II)-binding protein CopK [Methylophilus sp.]
MYKKLIAVAGTVFAMSAFAADMTTVTRAIELKDGSTLYIFKNGKMGMENKSGRAVSMKPGHMMETKDGQKLVMVGNEVMRVDSLLREKLPPN